MDADVKAKWIAALRSGNYKQANGRLKKHYTKEPSPRYCCLGVLCEVMSVPSEVNVRFENITLYKYESDSLGEGEALLPTRILKRAGLTTKQQRLCVEMNDLRGFSFEQIADMIEKEF